MKALNKIALDNDIPRVSTNAGRPRVDGLLVSLRDYVTGHPTLSQGLGTDAGLKFCLIAMCATATTGPWRP